jgi:[protein-PII] uridylyltransferase
VVLSGGVSEVARMDRVRRAQAELREALPDWPADVTESYAHRHSPAYWLKVEASRRLKHARFMREAESAGRSVATAFETDTFRGVTELTVMSPDHPRLLAIVTGACAAAGGNIVDAQIFTTTDGTALDTIFVSRAFDRDEDELRRAERIALAIERALKGEVKIADLVESKRPNKEPSKTFYVPPEVVIDNSLSTRHTVLEISGLDRPGLLYDLTTALGRINLNIASAHIATFGEKAVDVFYVTDLTGTKVSHPGRQAAIRRILLEVFQGAGEAARADGATV